MAKKPVFSKVIGAYIHSDVVDDFDHVRIDLDRKEAKRILHLAAVARREEVAHIHDYDWTSSFLSTDYDSDDKNLKEVDVSTDCEQVVVSKDAFWWEGYLKHTDPPISWSTDAISLQELRVSLMPMRELPKHIEEEDWGPDAVERVKARLAGK